MKHKAPSICLPNYVMEHYIKVPYIQVEKGIILLLMDKSRNQNIWIYLFFTQNGHVRLQGLTQFGFISKIEVHLLIMSSFQKKKSGIFLALFDTASPKVNQSFMIRSMYTKYNFITHTVLGIWCLQHFITDP